MLHIRDLEAFLEINRALAGNASRSGEGEGLSDADAELLLALLSSRIAGGPAPGTEGQGRPPAVKPEGGLAEVLTRMLGRRG
jgi:hypothetical protein